MAGVVEEVVECVIAVGAEPGDDPAAVVEVLSEAREDWSSGVGVEEREDVAGAHDDVEPVGDAGCGKIEFGEIGDEPGDAGVVVLCGGDEDRVDVDSDDVVTECGESCADASGAAAGVEDACVAGCHGVDEAGFAVEVVAGGGHGAESFDVPVGVAGVLFGEGDPSVRGHGGDATSRAWARAPVLLRRDGGRLGRWSLPPAGRFVESSTVRLEITRRAELAIRALALLGDSGERVKGPALADALGTTVKFVPQVLGPLVRAGWVSSDPGPAGGYRCQVALGDVSALAVIEAVDGPTDLGRCVVADRPCQAADPCVLHVAWAQARSELVRVLGATPIADVGTRVA